jgi:protein ImuB
MRVTRSERIRDEQTTLVDDPDATRHTDDLARLAETLRVRMGEEAVVRATPTECYVAEAAWEEKEELAGGERRATTDPRRATRDTPLTPRASRLATPHSPLLLHFPTELRVLVAPSHDRDGRPVQIVESDGRTHRIVHAIGPHRVAPLWWTGHDKTRDYFEVEDETGLRTWVFRVCETNRWFKQGIFA